jgi:hypothetical protein
MGEWCTIVGGTTTCVPNPGGVKCKGETCMADTECQAGLGCVDGKCSPFCCPNDDEPCGPGLCIVEVDYGNGVVGQMCAYPPKCDLLEDNCPSDALNCYAVNLEEAFAGCFAQSDQPAAEGENCMYLNDCGESSFCYEDPNIPSDPMVCRQLCDLASWMTEMVPTGGCPMGRQCTALTWPNTAWNNIGICLPGAGTGGSGGN